MSAELALRFERTEPDKWLSALLAVAVHVGLAVLLILGVSWQTQAPQAVEVQLYSAPPPAAPPRAVAPEPEIKPAPKPVKVEPPKPVPKVEPPPPPKPVIAQKEKPKPPEKLKPLEKPKPVEKPKPAGMPDWSKELKATEQSLSRTKLAEAAEKELQNLKASQAAALRAKGVAAWGDRIRAAIKRHIVVPPGVSGNPEAVFDVSLLPDGTVLAGSVKLRKSTGSPALDSAIERAIGKASPLPKPDDPSLFQRNLELKFRPLEDQ